MKKATVTVLGLMTLVGLSSCGNNSGEAADQGTSTAGATGGTPTGGSGNGHSAGGGAGGTVQGASTNIACPGTRACDIAIEQCCYSPDSSSCRAAPVACDADDLTAACDGACPLFPGMKCCLDTSAQFANCYNECFQGNVQLCLPTGPSACGTGKTCQASTLRPGYYECQ